MDELSTGVLAALASVLAGGAAEIVRYWFERLQINKQTQTVSYSEKLSKLAEKLENSSQEVDSVLREITLVMAERRGAVEKLEL